MYALRRFCGLKKNSLFFMDRSSQCHSQNADSPFSLVRSHLSIIPHYRQPITFHKRRFSILIGPFLIDSCQSKIFQVICIIFGPIRGRYLCFPIPLYYWGRPGQFVARHRTQRKSWRGDRKSFNTIEIPLRGDTGRPIPFLGGDVEVTLHFRKQ